MRCEHFFCPCPRGLETVLQEELLALGANDLHATEGGVAFTGDASLMRRVNLHSRIASRVLLRLRRGNYRDEKDLYQLAHKIDWPAYFPVECTIKVKTDGIKAPVRSLEFVSLTIKDAVCDRFRAAGGERPSVDTQRPDMRIHVFLNHNDASIYLDTSGEALFKRGYRIATGEAPIRENLAAGLLALAGWKPGVALFDPMCGSATFLIEAANQALNRAPGRFRHFAFERFHGFDEPAWQAEREQARQAELSPRALPIFGRDIDRQVLDAAHSNLIENGLDLCVSLEQGDMLEAPAPAASGVVISNPPYGVRLDELERLAALYPQMGHWMKRTLAGWNVYLFSADLRLAKLIRLSASKRTPLYNGGLECRLFEYKMIAGGNRPAR